MSAQRTFDQQAAVARWLTGESMASIARSVGVTGERIRQVVAHHVPAEYAAWKAAKRAKREAAETCPRCRGPKSRTGSGVCHGCAIETGAYGGPTIWTREVIIERMQAWVETYGRVPTATEWNPALATRVGRPDWAERFHADGCWPYAFITQTRFGSWNAAIAAAGFTPRRVGGREDRTRRQPLAVAKALA